MSNGARDILVRAREILFDEGWIKGQLHSPDGHCMLGATCKAQVSPSILDYVEVETARCALRRVLGTEVGNGGLIAIAIATANDAAETTFSDVIHWFDLAIKELES